MRHALSCLMLLFAAVAPAVASGGANDGAITKIAWVWVELDAIGQVTDVVQDEGQNDLVAGVLREHALQLDFTPATVDGVAVASGAPLELTVRFVPVDGGGLRPDLLDAQVQPARALAPLPPRYPSAAAVAGIGGFVRVALDVGGDGVVVENSIAVTDSGFFRAGSGRAGSGDRDSLVAATIESAARWTWRMARVGDETLAVRADMPVQFHPPKGSEGAPLPAPLAARATGSAPLQVLDPRVRMPALTNTFPDAPTAAERKAIQSVATRVRRSGAR